MEFSFASLSNLEIEYLTAEFINPFLNLRIQKNMNDFLYKYFVEPIQTHEGYNLVNTITYAAIALVCVFLIFRWFRKSKIKVDSKFILNIIPFVLLGSTVRVVTDSIYTGVFKPITPIHKAILDSHIYDYGYLTTSPGIYLVTAGVLLVSLFLLHKMKKLDKLWIVGTALFVPHLLLLVPFMKYALYSIPIILLAIIPALIIFKLYKSKLYSFMVFSQALDGAATFFIIDFGAKLMGIQYGEQHVISRGVGELFGTFFTFYLIKVLIASAVAYLLNSEKKNSEEEKNFIVLLIIIIGLAPGVRDILRMVVGG